MLKRLRSVLFIIGTFVIGRALPAVEKQIPHYHYTVQLVESGQGDYTGPWSPRILRDQLGPHVDVDEANFYEDFLTESVSTDILWLNDFWFKEYNLEKDCPNAVIAENGDYIRYLYRLLTLSYLFETVADYSVMLSQLGDTSQSCSIQWEDLFKQCTGNYEEMVKFLARSKGRTTTLVDQTRFALPAGRQEQEDLKKSMHELLQKSRGPRHAGEYRLQQAHLSGDMSFPAVRTTLQGLCRRDKAFMLKVCSEKDRLYGMSKIPQARLLVEHSNAMTVLRQKGHSNACLGRFTDLYSSNEEDYIFLQGIFQYGMQSIMERKGRYRQGSLFLLGALKEFDDKGLADVLKPIEEAVPVKIDNVPAVAVAPVQKQEVPAQLPKVETKVAVAEVKKKEEPPPKRVSQFELAVEERERTKSEEVAVNMQDMRLDFLFNEQLALSLSGPMQQFQTRKALTDMKKFDHLGSKSEPVRLLFLKFLIDHDFHQGLFNMTSVLGHHFWVINDIDKKKAPQYIRLQNDAFTNNRWQIYVMAPPKEEIQPTLKTE